MWWTEGTLKKLAAHEAAKALQSSVGREAVRHHLPELLTEPAIKPAFGAILLASLAAPGSKSAIRDLLLALLTEPVFKATIRDLLVGLLAEHEVKPLADRVTSDVRAIVGMLEAQIEKVLKAEGAKIAERKAE